MAEEACCCAYFQKVIDPGLCYDLQMILGGFIKASALPEVTFDKAELSECCKECKHAL